MTALPTPDPRGFPKIVLGTREPQLCPNGSPGRRQTLRQIPLEIRRSLPKTVSISRKLQRIKRMIHIQLVNEPIADSSQHNGIDNYITVYPLCQ